MSHQIETITDASYEAEIVNRTGVVLVDFWAPWCGPCTALNPLIKEIASDYASEVRVAKINADECKVAGKHFGVRGLPTLIVFKDGVECDRAVGLINKSRIATMLDKQLEA